MNLIVREKINVMLDNARRCAKREKDPKTLRDVIDADFYYASGAINALMRSDVISFSEWRYDRRVLKYHYCRLLATYANMPYMYKDGDRDFYLRYIR